jgi:hypothetical protein
MGIQTPGSEAQKQAREIASVIRAYGCDNIADYRLMLMDLHGLPMAPEASKALAAAIYHLDGVEIACRALCEALGA